MKKDNLKFSNFIVSKGATIKDAMASMNDNKKGTVIVVDDKFRVLGTVSDGDIRRSVVKGRDILSCVDEIMNLNPWSARHGELEKRQAEEIFKKDLSIRLIPVVDCANKLVDVIMRV